MIVIVSILCVCFYLLCYLLSPAAFGGICSFIMPGLIFMKMLFSIITKQFFVISITLFVIMFITSSSFILLSVYLYLYFPSLRFLVICLSVSDPLGHHTDLGVYMFIPRSLLFITLDGVSSMRVISACVSFCYGVCISFLFSLSVWVPDWKHFVIIFS